MKKKKILLMFFTALSVFIFNNNILNASSLSCNDIILGDNIICDIKTDETVYITSSLKIESVSGENNSYSGKIATFTSNGTISFKPTSEGEYKIKITNIDESFTNTKTVLVSEKKVTTSTTTTTKKKSSVNLLKTITIDNEEIEGFSSDKTKYYVTVNNDVNSILIDAVALDSSSTLEISKPKELIVGDNLYTISVTAEDGTIKNYKVIVTKKDKEIIESNDTSINDIVIKNYNLKFDKYSKTFYLNINKEDTKLDIEVDTNSKLAQYEIIGNEKLKNGSVIKIVVTAEDKSTDTYRIIIQKKEKNILPIIILSTVLILFIIILIIILINKKKNKPNKNEIVANKKESVKEYTDEKTIEIASINNDNIKVDNDEEETKMFTYDKSNEDSKIGKIIDDELEKTITFDDDF